MRYEEEEARRTPRRPTSHYRDTPRSRNPTGSSGLAIAALIFGLLSFPCLLGPLVALPAIVLGISALASSRVRSGELAGKGKAVAGLLLGIVGLVVLAPLIYLFMTGNREAEQLPLKQIGIALHAHHDVNGCLPASRAFESKDGKSGLSWRVAILPYIEQDNLYKQFKLDEPWDSPHNKNLLGSMPRVYLQTGEQPSASGLTHYQCLVGPRTAFEETNSPGPMLPMRRGICFNQITDGVSSTIFVVVAKNPVPWTKPDDLEYDPNKPLPQLQEKFGSIRVLMGDGSVRHLPRSIDETTLRNMITRNDGYVIQIPR